ncbi:GCN5-related N-acetyltransferase [Rhodovulum sp. P5]|uniref:GNAT family N-acetyltransferase n=1 Tax=Rhodovulum sp. P5 TaxID=1564506 RepID=UPI0009C30FD9|nr:GNAT family N-acetyltransferase [Rhodovulum sp. P5]ARE39480.1 GCN5-related N-acetyltransferase [Rhodovulum sp. P5]
MKLRQMSRAELDIVLHWAGEEGWNPGLDDADAFYATDPGGFFVAEVAGAPVAAISVVNHSPGFAFLGLYICRPDHRGQGIGYALWQHALAHAGARTIGLDGVPAQQENYRRSGFVLAAQNQRFSGVLSLGEGTALRPVTPDDLPALIDLEAAANGYRKEAFLSAWLRDTATRQTYVLAGAEPPAGFVTLRQCLSGYKIGPLVAPGLETATALIAGAGRLTEGASVMIDVPSDQPALAAQCEAMGMAPCFSTARMYRGTAPGPGAECRTIATLELG